MRRYLFLTSVFFLIGFPVIGQSALHQNVQEEKRLALVIGNGNYIGNILANPENDARAMKEVLANSGFEVLEYENLKQGQMKKAIDEFGMKLKNFDVGLFFYAGHGIQSRGLNYLIPVDADLQTEASVEYDCVQADRVLALMEESGAKVKIVILDACRNNPFERTWTRATAGKGLATMNAPSGTLIAYSTAPGSTASDGSGKNSIYTTALLESITIPDITVLQMFQNVRTVVSKRSNKQQIPWEATSLTGDFYFYRDRAGRSAEQQTQQTNPVINLPAVAIPEIINITSNEVTVRASVTRDGGAHVVARGICLSISEKPSINDTKTIDGDGVGTFMSTLSSLKPGTIYYSRAYAINSAGVGYSPQTIIKTIPAIPSIITQNVKIITADSAVAEGNISGDGGAKILLRGICWSTKPDPTIFDKKAESGSGKGIFRISIDSLLSDTIYFLRAFASNETDTYYGNEITLRTLRRGQVIDIDGNVYNTTPMYGQIWLTENLRTTHFNDGEPIPQINDLFTWRQKAPAFCWYNNDENLKKPFGALYTYQAVSRGNLCPLGWHVSSADEWQKIIQSFGGRNIAGNYLKENGFTHWQMSSQGNTSILSYFSALPGGCRDELGQFKGIGQYGYWWSFPGIEKDLFYYYMGYDSFKVTKVKYNNESLGLSVRCLKD